MPFPANLKQQLTRILDAERVRDDDLTLYSYDSDGLTTHAARPMGVVFPKTTEEVSALVKCLVHHGVTFLPRGAGTGLSGGAIPVEESVLVEMFHFRDVHDINTVDRTITVGPGLVNIKVSDAVRELGFQFVPDPSSQKACSIGGNVGENAGGPHTLKYGVTVNHILGLEVVLPDGEVVMLGGRTLHADGPDLLGLFIGSEGTFGIVTKVVCRLTPLPEKIITMLAIFNSVDASSRCVSGVISAGIVPAAMEMLDNAVITAIEKCTKPGFPVDAEALLIIEIEGLADGLEEEAASIIAIAEKCGAVRVSRAANDQERDVIWSARKGAFAALGAVSPNYITQDGVVPRAKLPFILKRIREVAAEAGLVVANVFHAGDGNLHPLVLYNEKIEGETEKAFNLGLTILTECVKAGGSLTGEHGIGLEKIGMMPLIFSAKDLENFALLKLAFDPDNIINPGKILPQPGRCSEMRHNKARQGAAV